MAPRTGRGKGPKGKGEKKKKQKEEKGDKNLVSRAFLLMYFALGECSTQILTFAFVCFIKFLFSILGYYLA